MGRLRLTEQSVPGTPSAGAQEIFPVATDRRWKSIDDLGIVSVLSYSGPRENVLINGGFDFAQRQAPASLTTYSNTSGRAHGADRWGMTNENASIQFQRVDTVPTPVTGISSRFYGVFKKLTSAGKFIISQFVEQQNMASMRGRYVTFQVKMKFNTAGSMTVRIGVLRLAAAGTANLIPATFVSAFGAVGTDPTFGTNLALIAPTAAYGGTISGNAVSCILTSSFVLYAVKVLVPTDCKNLAVVIFTNGQPAAADELWCAEAQLSDGLELRDWSPTSYTDELCRCERYFAKTFAVDTLPAQGIGLGNMEFRFIAGKAGALAEFGYWPLRVDLFSGGTTAPAATYYNPAGADAQVRDITGAVTMTATATTFITRNSVQFGATGNAGTAVGNSCGVHIAVEAEM